MEEVDYLGIATVLASTAGVPRGRIGDHHIGGLHDVVNTLGATSLLLGLFSIGVVAALVLLWSVSQGLHRVVVREILSVTTLPIVGAVLFMTIAQLADIDHPVLDVLLGHAAVVQDLREEPMELLAVVCVNASFLAKLLPLVRQSVEIKDRRGGL
jgi:hypothetical protein